jgi:methionine-S-sulfoxide reductase
MPGVIRTRVGYAGGDTPNPTYHDLGGHTESLQVDYDPERVSFAELLAVFWELHDPAHQSWSVQYQNVLFFHDEEQRRQALAAKERLEAAGTPVRTRIEPLQAFHVAEDYHQKYYLRLNRNLARELMHAYPDPEAFRESTAAARLNGYLGGHGDLDQLRAELDGLGLAPDTAQGLWRTVARRVGEPAASCPVPGS